MKKRLIPEIIIIVVLVILGCVLPGCSEKPSKVDFGGRYYYELRPGDEVQLVCNPKGEPKSVKYINSGKTVVSVSDTGKLTALKEGTAGVDIVVKYDTEDGKTEVYENNIYIKVIGEKAKPVPQPSETGYFDVSFETESYCNPGGTIVLKAAFVNPDASVSDNIEWKSLDEKTATVDDKGNVKGIKTGNAVIRATCRDNGEIFDFTVTVLPKSMSDSLKHVVANHNSNALVVYNLGIGDGTPAYYYDIVGSVNNILFDDLIIDDTYYDVLEKYQKNDGDIPKVEFITVHYTGNMAKTADADNNADYFNNLSYSASIHFVTGRTNLYGPYSRDKYRAFSVLNEKYMGWHASGYGAGDHKWLDTGLKKLKNDPDTPVISINYNGYFTVNGRTTAVKVPDRGDIIDVLGPTFEYYGGDICNSINSQGIAWKVEKGKYYIGNTYWGTQQWGMTLSNVGGNFRSIGIESCVDRGSDLVHTWHVTAQLVAKLMVKYNLDITRVQGHHFFSGKDCPQPLLENDMQLWDVFIDYVKAEKTRLDKYGKSKPKMYVEESGGVLNEYGLLKQDSRPHCVTYNIEIGKESVTLSTIVESNLKRSPSGSRKSLQELGEEIA